MFHDQVPVETKVADPQLGSEVHLTHWVENSFTVLPGTDHRIILYWWQVRSLLERCVECGQWYNHPGGLKPGAGPHVP